MIDECMVGLSSDDSSSRTAVTDSTYSSFIRPTPHRSSGQRPRQEGLPAPREPRPGHSGEAERVGEAGLTPVVDRLGARVPAGRCLLLIRYHHLLLPCPAPARPLPLFLFATSICNFIHFTHCACTIHTLFFHTQGLAGLPLGGFVVETDIAADNGIIHVVDGVFKPQTPLPGNNGSGSAGASAAW